MNEDALSSRQRAVSLLECYEALLTDKQREIMDDYYRYDLSLGEIAENRNISRAGVYDTLKKSSEKLEDYESKLLLLAKKEEFGKKLERIEQEEDPSKKLKAYQEFGKEITHGI
ncbi:MAG TPA: hypothetical protein DEA63_02360 [Firmicutes bacterium]|nr:hypothetical protein [Bacillota bacterium]